MEESYHSDETQQTIQMLLYLANGLNIPPDKDFVNNLREGYRGEAEEVRCFWQEFEDADDAKIAEALAVEWTKLFRGIGPEYGPRPPYTGVYMSNDGIGVEKIAEIKQTYDLFGYSPQKDDRADYLGNILEFCAFMLVSANAAEENGGENGGKAILRELKAFMNANLNPWLQGFTRSAEKFANNYFYKDFLGALPEILEAVNELCDTD